MTEEANKALNPRQKAFVEQYLVDRNGTQAAIRAGYSEKTAQEQGSRLLSYAIVQQAIQEGTKEQTKRVQVTADEVINLILEIARGDSGAFVHESGRPLTLAEFKKLPPSLTRTVSEISVDKNGHAKLKFWNKMDAIEKLCRFLGLNESTLTPPEPPAESGNTAPVEDPLIDALTASAEEDWDDYSDGLTDE